MKTAQISTDGINQIITLPEDFYLTGSEAYIKKVGEAIVLIDQDSPWQSLLINELNQSIDNLLCLFTNFLRIITTYPENAQVFNNVFSQILNSSCSSNSNDEATLNEIDNHQKFLVNYLKTSLTQKPDYLRVDLEDNLMSEKDISYTNLQYYLRNQDWEEANYETYLAILQCINSLEGQSIESIAKVTEPKRSYEKAIELIDMIPKTDLQTINRLWTKYSQGHFGFWVQKRIFVKNGGQIPHGINDRDRFFKLLGWINKSESGHNVWLDYSEFNYTLNAPKGHLPNYRFYSSSPTNSVHEWNHFMTRFVQVGI